MPDRAQRPYDRAAEDVGNLVALEHVNVRIPDQQLATIFYVTGLGLTRDPYLMTGVTNMWINVGRSQFHLPTGSPQVLRGAVGLVLPDIAALAARLRRIAPLMSGTRFAFAETDDAIEVTSPWGNRLRCHPPSARFGPMRLGMPYVELDVRAGAAAGIARFYREILQAPATSGEDGRGAFARVVVGPGQELIFRETDQPLPLYDGHHLQIYVADFSGPHGRLKELTLVSEESDQHQYRFCEIVDPADGERLHTIEHEVRSLRHPLYGRHLVNRNPEQTNTSYVPGGDAWHE